MAADPRWLWRQISQWFAVFSFHFGSAGFYLWDLVPVMYLLEPERFEEELVELASSAEDLKTGQLVVRPVLSQSHHGGVLPLPPMSICRARLVAI